MRTSTSSSPRVHAFTRMLRVLRELVTSIWILAMLLVDRYRSSGMLEEGLHVRRVSRSGGRSGQRAKEREGDCGDESK